MCKQVSETDLTLPAEEDMTQVWTLVRACKIRRQANQNILTTILVPIFRILSMEKRIMYTEESFVRCLHEAKPNLI
jgi:hypothetical protein